MLNFLTVCFRIVNFSTWIISTATHRHRRDQVLHRRWQVQVTRLTQLPDCCNHVVVDVVRSDIRYLGSFSKKNPPTHLSKDRQKHTHTHAYAYRITTLLSRLWFFSLEYFHIGTKIGLNENVEIIFSFIWFLFNDTQNWLKTHTQKFSNAIKIKNSKMILNKFFSSLLELHFSESMINK